MKIALFNVKYSRNVGDGFLSECLEHALATRVPGAEIRVFDLSGREAYGGGGLHSRRRILEVLHVLPAVGRRAVVRMGLWRSLARSRARWGEALADCDVAIVGGGHLFQDDDINFALKVNAVARACEEAGVPLCIQSVGVSQTWSAAAARLFGGLSRCDILHASARDRVSVASWNRHFAGTAVPAAGCSPDPGALAASVYGAAPAPSRGRGAKVAVGVAHPALLKRHATCGVAGVLPDPVRFYGELAGHLVGAGYGVRLFTNGATEDEEHLDAVVAAISTSGAALPPGIAREARPMVPADLHGIVARADVVVAHRLHANIAAHALSRPSVGLAWDRKLEDFLRSVTPDSHPLLLATAEMRAPEVAALTERAIEVGIDAESNAEFIGGAASAVDALVARFAIERKGADARGKVVA